MMRHFGYYVTESSEHSAEYMPYWIKSQFPELIDEFNIPLDEYPRRCVAPDRGLEGSERRAGREPQPDPYARTHEYGSYIMEAMETDVPFRIGGNVLNTGLITNLPPRPWSRCPCMVDRNGVQGCSWATCPSSARRSTAPTSTSSC